VKILGGKAFRAPSPYELYNEGGGQYRSGSVCQATDPIDPKTGQHTCNLAPEQVISAEVEYSHRFSNTVTGLVTGYANYVSNLIELENVVDSSGNQGNEYRNSVNPVAVLGGEVELRREWRQGWMLSASATISRAGYITTVQDGGGQSHQCISTFYINHSCGGLGEVPNSPLILAALKGAVPIIGRQLMVMSRLSFEGIRYDNAVAVFGPGTQQGTTDPGLIWDIVFSGEVEKLGIHYAVGAYNVMDWKYQAVPSVEFPERVIPQNGRTFLASVSASF
jgi:outer membrane receptor protein involved in Fe transport